MPEQKSLKQPIKLLVTNASLPQINWKAVTATVVSPTEIRFPFRLRRRTDLTYGFGLVSATAKVHWHKFGFGRNITPKRRNCKIGANCITTAQKRQNLGHILNNFAT